MSVVQARRLRRNSTDTEQHLWKLLRGRQLSGYRFRRQHPIGKFIVDFACTRYRLIVEADGGQHADSTSDIERTKYFEAQGWKVIRFWNNEVLSNEQGVLQIIQQTLDEAHDNPSPDDC